MNWMLVFALLFSNLSQAELQTVEIKGKDPLHNAVQKYQLILSLPDVPDPKSSVKLFQSLIKLEFLREAAKSFPIAFANLSRNSGALTLSTEWDITHRAAEVLKLEQPRPIILIDEKTDQSMIVHELQHAQDFSSGEYQKWKTRLSQISYLKDHPSVLEEILRLGLEWRGYSGEILELQSSFEGIEAIEYVRDEYKNIYYSEYKTFKNLKKSQSVAYDQVLEWFQSIEIQNTELPFSIFTK